MDIKINNQITEQEALELLQNISSGAVKINPVPDITYSGNQEYIASNGYTLVVFIDVGEWDYIDYIEAPDGRNLDFDYIWDNMPTLLNYSVPGTEQEDIWGL